ncbi:MAG: GNAT family N-acetyltransferase [Endomicrobia bacterium]|nr:GNAT family N-acetyltransferase [Endomicrobiia bacterium]
MSETQIIYLYGCERKDVPQIAKLINTNLEFDNFSPSQVEHLIFDDPHFSPEYIIRGYRNDNLISFLCGVNAFYKQKKVGWIKMFVVDKMLKFQGIGKQMFGIIEQKFSSCDEIRIMDSVPCYFQPGVDVRYTEAIVFLETLGYKKVGENIHLETNLDNVDFTVEAEAENRIQQLGYKIKQVNDELYPLLLSWLTRTFPAWEFEVKFAYKNVPPKIFAAIYNNDVVGFACYDTTSAGWFGPIGVDPQHRKVGIGKILLLKCLHALKNSGYKQIIIPWISPSSLKFYTTTCNAKISRCFWVYVKSHEKQPNTWM